MKKQPGKKNSGKSTAPTNNWLSTYGHYVLLIALPLLLYGKTIWFNFTHHDDDMMIADNVALLKTLSVKDVLLRDAWFQPAYIELYRPWQSITYLIDFKWWEANPMGYHIHNLVVFIASVLLLFRFLLQLGFQQQTTLLLAAMYACLPVFAHTVGWIPARGDLYLTLFGLATLRFALQYHDTGLAKHLAATYVFFTLALLAKETAIMLLPMMALLLYVRNPSYDIATQMRKLMWMAGFAIPLALYFYLRSKSVASTGFVGFHALLYNWPTIPESVFKFFVPFNFTVLPFYETWRTIGGIVIFIGLLAAVWKFASANYRLALLGIAFWLLPLLPSLAYQPNFSGFAYDYLDHRMFLCGIGLLITLGTVIEPLLQQFKKQTTIAIAVICLLQGGFAWSHINSYRDYTHYYNNAFETSPRSGLAILNYAMLLRGKEQKYQEAIELLNKGLAMYPDSFMFYNEKALNYYLLKQYDSMYQNAAAMKNMGRARFEYHTYMGLYASVKEDLPAAITAFENALKERPQEVSTYLNRAKAFRKAGQNDKAIADLDKALQIAPGYADAYNERGNLYGNLGYFDKSLADYIQYVNLRPDDPIGYFYRGQAYYFTGNKLAACNDIRKAAEMKLPEAQGKLREICM